MALTPEQQAELNALTLEQIELMKERGELNQAQLDHIEKLSKQEKESLDAAKARLQALKDANTEEESLYTHRIRSNEQAHLQLKIAKDELKVMEAKVLAGGALEEVDQKRYELLKTQMAGMEKAMKANDRAVEGHGNLFEDKVGGAIMRVGQMMSRSYGDRLLALNNSLSGMVDKGFAAMGKAAIDLVFQFDSLTKSFERQMQLGPAYTESIESQYQSLNEYGVSLEDAIESQTQLATSYTDFTMLTVAQRDSLTETSAVLNELGVAQSDFARGVQNSTKFFGQSTAQAEVTQRELMTTARALGREPGVLAAEFAAAGGSLAKFGEQGVKAFKDLSRVAKITGMEMDKVLSMTNKFDTFEGAAEQAGKLNAAMGGNMVNAMDMMMETDPAARFETLRESILNTVGSFDDMSYYQKQFYAESLGLSDVGDLAMMLSGNMDDLAGATNQSAEELIAEKERAKDVQSAQEELALAMAQVVEQATVLAPILQSVVGFIGKLAQHANKIIPIMVAYKTVLALVSAQKAIMAMVDAGLISSESLLAKASAKSSLKLFLVVGAIAALAAALMIASPSKVVLAIFGLAAGLFAVGKVGERVGAGLAVVSSNMIAIGAGTLLAGAGLAIMAAGFSLLSVPQMLGMAAALLAFGAAMYFAAPAIGAFAVTMAGVAPALVMAAPGLLILGLFIATIAGSIFVAAAGVALMGVGMAMMFDSLDIPKAIAFGALVFGLAIAAPGLVAAGFGFAGVGAGMLLFGLALKMISTRDLEAMGQFAVGMSEMNVGNINALVTALRAVADAMDEIPTAKAIMLTATLDAAAIAARASNAIVGRSSGQEGTRTQASASKQKPQPVNVHVTLELDGEVLDRRIVKTSTDARSSGGLLDTVANILN